MKYLALLFSFFFSSLALNSQIVFGIKGGVNFSKLEFSDFGKTRVGFHLGGFLELPTDNEYIFIQPELLLAQYGGRDSYDPNERFIMGSICVPVMAKYLIKSQFYPEAGLQFNYHFSGVYNDYGDKEDLSDEIVRFDFGLALGGGVKITDEFHVNLRYYIGFNNLLDKDFPEGRNRTLHLSAGYTL